MDIKLKPINFVEFLELLRMLPNDYSIQVDNDTIPGMIDSVSTESEVILAINTRKPKSPYDYPAVSVVEFKRCVEQSLGAHIYCPVRGSVEVQEEPYSLIVGSWGGTRRYVTGIRVVGDRNAVICTTPIWVDWEGKEERDKFILWEMFHNVLTLAERMRRKMLGIGPGTIKK